MGAVVMDRARVERGAVVAAGAVVPPGAVIPARHLAAGVPAKVLRELGPEELERNRAVKDRYLRVQECYRDPALAIDFSGEP
jgi:carbonic anhydrase/acetyltransferase-like protein (isoleucine patch superfamily)